MLRRLAPLALAAAVLAAAPPARADAEPARRRLRIAERGGSLLVWGSFTDVFDEKLLAELSSGFVTMIVVRVYVVDQGSNTPIAATAATYRVVYDIWDEIYIVRVNDPGGERETRLGTRAEALKEVTTMRALPVAAAGSVPVGVNHYVAVVVEVNPISEELLAEVRRWLARPPGSSGPGGSSFFGSFVSVFVNPPLDEAARVLRFRSQTFYRTGP
jgi:hypothetical protein